MEYTIITNIRQYMDFVMEELEKIEYPDLIMEFDSDCVARSIAGTCVIFFALGQSPRLCAIMIWSLTMNEQIIPQARNAVKH